MIKHSCLIILLLIICGYCAAQPPTPSPCTASSNPNISITGSTSFTFTTLSSFNSSQSSNAIQITLKSKNTAYTLYIAGVVTALTGSSTNTVIPINTFTAAASARGTAPAAVTLSNSYLPIAIDNNGTAGNSTTTQTITITLNPTVGGAGAINKFTQAPGTHTLTLYFYICN
ncbi:hypothetical protein [Mucilaginibacter sp.]